MHQSDACLQWVLDKTEKMKYYLLEGWSVSVAKRKADISEKEYSFLLFDKNFENLVVPYYKNYSGYTARQTKLLNGSIVHPGENPRIPRGPYKKKLERKMGRAPLSKPKKRPENLAYLPPVVEEKIQLKTFPILQDTLTILPRGTILPSLL